MSMRNFLTRGRLVKLCKSTNVGINFQRNIKRLLRLTTFMPKAEEAIPLTLLTNKF